MPVCKRLRRWHSASLPSSNEIPVLLGLLEFSDWHLAQVLVEACHIVSSQAYLRHFRHVPVPYRMFVPFKRGAFVSLRQ